MQLNPWLSSEEQALSLKCGQPFRVGVKKYFFNLTSWQDECKNEILYNEAIASVEHGIEK